MSKFFISLILLLILSVSSAHARRASFDDNPTDQRTDRRSRTESLKKIVTQMDELLAEIRITNNVLKELLDAQAATTSAVKKRNSKDSDN